MVRQKIRNTILLISFLLFPVTLNFFSPYLPIAGAIEGIIVGSLMLFTFQFFTSLFFGRAFCSWICPAGALQDYCANVNPREAKRGKLNLIKWIIWLPWIIIIITLLMNVGVKKIDPLFLTESGVSIDRPMKFIIYYFVVGLIVILALAVGKRAFCHYSCWMAPFMILGTKVRGILRLPSLALKVQASSCVSCNACTFNCPMSLLVQEMVEKASMKNSECILCGNCVDNCKQNVISYTFKPIK